MLDTQQQSGWRVIANSVTGAAHERSGRCNQDAYLKKQEQEKGLPLILALADGHGNDKYFRSETGAKLAVEIAVEELTSFARASSEAPEVNQQTIKDMGEKVPRDIVRQWREKVENHWKHNRPTEEEWQWLNKEPANTRKHISENCTIPYGTTLLAALVTSSFLFLLQLGDGDIMVVSDNGEVVKPIEGDDRLLANETTSLCTPTAISDFRRKFRFDNTSTALILLSTDGYSNSFNQESGFLKVGADIWQMMRSKGDIEAGIDEVDTNLEGWLKVATMKASGDDITLGIICHINTLTEKGKKDEEFFPLQDGNNGGQTSESKSSESVNDDTQTLILVVGQVPSTQEGVSATATTPESNDVIEKQSTTPMPNGSLLRQPLRDDEFNEKTVKNPNMLSHRQNMSGQGLLSQHSSQNREVN